MDAYKRNNEGGWGNPPIDGQFNGKPGPGRPTGSKSLDAALRKVFSGKVSYRENGEAKKGSAAEALSKRALQLGLSGSQRANAAALELAEKYGAKESVPQNSSPTHLHELTDEELDTLFTLSEKANGRVFRPEPRNRPLNFSNDPTDDRNYHFESTVDGLCYRRCDIASVSDELVSIDSRAYVSATLARPRSFNREL